MGLDISRTSRPEVILKSAVHVGCHSGIKAAVATAEQVGAPSYLRAHAADGFSRALLTFPARSLRANGFCMNETSAVRSPISGAPLA